jgi:hypothetical protein
MKEILNEDLIETRNTLMKKNSSVLKELWVCSPIAHTYFTDMVMIDPILAALPEGKKKQTNGTDLYLLGNSLALCFIDQLEKISDYNSYFDDLEEDR